MESSTNSRRRRRFGRQIREQTPDPNFRRHLLADNNNSKKANEAAIEADEEVQTISMQIRAPRPISSHESKILRRRDKGLVSAAIRSQSQPRVAEKVTNTAIIDALKYPMKRSLSTPRKNEDESSDNDALLRLEKTYSTESNLHLQGSDNGDNLSRLQRNMQRFEKERRRLQSDKLIFEIEKCEHKLRCKQLLSQEERRRLIQNYRKLSSQFDREQENLENNKPLKPYSNSKTRRRYYDESSTQLSSSDSIERDDEDHGRKTRNIRNIKNDDTLRKTIQTSAAELATPKPEDLNGKLLESENKLSEKDLLEDYSKLENVNQEQESSKIDGENSSELDNVPTTIPTTSSRISIFQKLLRLIFKKNLDVEAKNSANKQRTKTKEEKNFLRVYFDEIYMEYRCDLEELHRLSNICIIDTIILILLIGFGGLLFRYTEGTAENTYKCEVRKVKRDFIEQLWLNSHNMREDDWKFLARQKLRRFEDELHNMRELGLRYFPGQKSWNFVNSMLYCWAVITTVGYGHITPKTTLGQSLTIVYAIIGIPMFLILLADFGKLFTRVIKFIWGFIRRLYYTGTCRKIRKQQQTGFTVVYDMAKRRSSHFLGKHKEDGGLERPISKSPTVQIDTPTTIYPGSIVVDDEFNLPISLASVLLISYILIGAFAYTLWEEWTYFEAFYFVFISMSTIGFGDFVPDHPIFMMCSIIYMVFGLALTSMFINVVQIKLSDTFKQASTKIGATIGLCDPNTPSAMIEANEFDDKASQVTNKTPSDQSAIQIHTNATFNLENGNTVQASSPPTQSDTSPSRETLQTKSPAYKSYDNANMEEAANAKESLLPKEHIDAIKLGKKTKSY